MSTQPTLTDRQRFWLNHIQTCAAGTQSLKAYADENGLAVSALYEAKSRLTRRGVLEASAPPPRFVRVEPPRASAVRSCVHLPNGSRVEVVCDDIEALLRAVAKLP